MKAFQANWNVIAAKSCPSRMSERQRESSASSEKNMQSSWCLQALACKSSSGWTMSKQMPINKLLKFWRCRYQQSPHTVMLSQSKCLRLCHSTFHELPLEPSRARCAMVKASIDHMLALIYKRWLDKKICPFKNSALLCTCSNISTCVFLCGCSSYILLLQFAI